MDLPAPVSPVTTFRPGCNSSVRSATSARFLMRSVVSMTDFFAPNLAGVLAFGKTKSAVMKEQTRPKEAPSSKSKRQRPTAKPPAVGDLKLDFLGPWTLGPGPS